MSTSASSPSVRHGLLLCHLETVWSDLAEEQVSLWQNSLQGWSGKAEELRRNLPMLDMPGQVREGDLDSMRQLALELRANCDDILLVGSAASLDLARLHELFPSPGGRGPQLHLPRSQNWQQLLPQLERSRVGLVILGWLPGDACWDRVVAGALQWMKGRYREEELSRRVVALSNRSLAKLVDCPLRSLAVQERAGQAPAFSSFGLFPLYLAGLEASSLIEGARSQVRSFEKTFNSDNPTLRQAIIRQILVFQEGWVESIAIPDRFLEPLGLWVRRLWEVSSWHTEPPPPFPFPYLHCQEWEPHPGERSNLLELVIDYPSPQLEPDLSRCWLGLPRLDLYTVGGFMVHLATVAALNQRWNEQDHSSQEIW